MTPETKVTKQSIIISMTKEGKNVEEIVTAIAQQGLSKITDAKKLKQNIQLNIRALKKSGKL